ncbi:MAG: hypothetical protein EXR27_17545 [Betaproteobacteria bacterium]|nr:hypothetical protein [Betaproteobacteria bacterium]
MPGAGRDPGRRQAVPPSRAARRRAAPFARTRHGREQRRPPGCRSRCRPRGRSFSRAGESLHTSSTAPSAPRPACRLRRPGFPSSRA